MKRRLTLAAIVFCLAIPATAQFKTVQLAHEVRLSTIRLPAAESGTLAFRPCAACEFQTVRVNGDTRWMVNQKQTTLKDFRTAIEQVPDRDNEYLTVRHHLEKDLITQVSITIR